MGSILSITFLIALFAGFFLLLAYKWKLVELLQTRGNKLISALGNCRFCLSFWACLIFSVGFAIGTGNLFVIVLAVPATPLTRFLI